MPAWQETWNSMSKNARRGAAIGAVVVLVLAIVAAIWTLSSRYDVLFTGLDQQDAAAAVAELKRMKVEYRLEEGGTQIVVPSDRVQEIRLSLMSTGVPLAGGIGFEIFDNSDFGITEFAQRINFQRALQGELTRTIMSLKEVKYARVHLVLPEGGLFQKETRAPTASVTLFLKQGQSLSDAQIVGIQRLVASSVQGMEIQRVTVTDQMGITLSRDGEQETGGAAVSVRLQKKQEVEAYLRRKVAEVLEPVFGAGKAVVSVDVTLDLDNVKRTREDVLPAADGAVARKRESRSVGNTSKTNNNESVNKEVEYKLGKQIEQIVKTPGGIRRISIGVLVPEDTDAVRIEKVSELVAMAVGLDKNRGDAIAVHPVAKTAEDVPAAMTKDSLMMAEDDAVASGAVRKAGITNAVFDAPLVWVIGGLVVLLVAFVSALRLRRRAPVEVSARPLSQAERDRVLVQLREWLDSAEGQPEGEGAK